MALSLPLLIVSLIVVRLCWRIVQWRLRVASMSKQLPVVALFMDPHVVLRNFIPSRWQSWNGNWCFQNRQLAKDYNPELLPVVSLFGRDMIYVSDVDAVAEIASSPLRFPKDLRLYGTRNCEFPCDRRGVECFRDKCRYDRGGGMAIPS
jgi:hypothetical protein